MIKIKTFENWPIGENTYVVSDETGEAVIIDCGAIKSVNQEEIAAYVAAEGLTVKRHLLTHGHFDHMMGAQWVSETYGCLPEVMAEDAGIYMKAVMMATWLFHKPWSFPIPKLGPALTAGGTLTFGTHALSVIPTPGHTPGGCSLYCESEGVVFTGDSLFRGSIGRTDLGDGDHTALIQGLRERILTLPDEVKVYPGHGPMTTVKAERTGNMYL